METKKLEKKQTDNRNIKRESSSEARGLWERKNQIKIDY